MCVIDLLVLLLLKGGFTPLDRAYDHGHCSVVEFLLSNGAKVNIRDKVSICT